MDKDQLTTILEESGMESDQIQQVLTQIDSNRLDPSDLTPGVNSHNSQTDLKLQLLNEPDWRKRASISARIISKSLEA